MTGKKIRELRKANNLTMRDLAEKSGTASSYISDLENGKIKNPSGIKLKKIAKALGVSVIDILYPTNEDKEKAVAEAQDILKQEFYDKPAAETLGFLLGQITDTRLKSIYSEKLKNNELNSKEIQLLIEELAKILEYILYKMNTRDK